MEKIDPSVDALKHLCQKVGGHKMLALEIGVNDQTIYQIVSGVKLPPLNRPCLSKKLGVYPIFLEFIAFRLFYSIVSLEFTHAQNAS